MFAPPRPVGYDYRLSAEKIAFLEQAHYRQPKLYHDRMCAAEIEIGEFRGDFRPLRKHLESWGAAVVRDGSIPHGFEINTPPSNETAGKKGFSQPLRETLRIIKANNYSLYNAGIHVHVDARDLTNHDLFHLILLWGKIEQGVYDLVAPERSQSRFCTKSANKYLNLVAGKKIRKQPPYEKSQDVKPFMLDCVYGSSYQTRTERARRAKDTGAMKILRYDIRDRLNSLRNQKYNDARYAGLNLHSFYYRKTIEFRMLEGSVDHYLIVNWIRLCREIVNAATRLSSRQISLLPSDSYTALLSAVAQVNPKLTKFIERRRTQILTGEASWEGDEE